MGEGAEMVMAGPQQDWYPHLLQAPQLAQLLLLCSQQHMLQVPGAAITSMTGRIEDHNQTTGGLLG